VPLIVKDNFNTADMPTTAGSLSLKGSIPASDAFQVRKLREAGALVLAKSNMAEFAWSPFETVSAHNHWRSALRPDRPKQLRLGSAHCRWRTSSVLLGKSGLGPDRLLRRQRPPSYLGQFVQKLAAPLLRDRIHRRPFGGRKASDQILDVLGYEKMSVVGAAGSDRLIEVAIGDDFTASMPILVRRPRAL